MTVRTDIRRADAAQRELAKDISWLTHLQPPPRIKADIDGLIAKRIQMYNEIELGVKVLEIEVSKEVEAYLPTKEEEPIKPPPEEEEPIIKDPIEPIGKG